VYVIVAKRYIPLKCDCLCQNQHLIRFVLQDIIALAKITRKQMMMPSFLCWSITVRSSHLVYYLLKYHIFVYVIFVLVTMKKTTIYISYIELVSMESEVWIDVAYLTIILKWKITLNSLVHISTRFTLTIFTKQIPWER